MFGTIIEIWFFATSRNVNNLSSWKQIGFKKETLFELKSICKSTFCFGKKPQKCSRSHDVMVKIFVLMLDWKLILNWSNLHCFKVIAIKEYIFIRYGAEKFLWLQVMADSMQKQLWRQDSFDSMQNFSSSCWGHSFLLLHTWAKCMHCLEFLHWNIYEQVGFVTQFFWFSSTPWGQSHLPLQT